MGPDAPTRPAIRRPSDRDPVEPDLELPGPGTEHRHLRHSGHREETPLDHLLGVRVQRSSEVDEVVPSSVQS